MIRVYSLNRLGKYRLNPLKVVEGYVPVLAAPGRDGDWPLFEGGPGCYRPRLRLAVARRVVRDSNGENRMADGSRVNRVSLR